MLIEILPGTIDNTFRGHPSGLWLFELVVSMKLMMSLTSIFDGHHVLNTADGIPLDTYPAAAARRSSRCSRSSRSRTWCSLSFA